MSSTGRSFCILPACLIGISLGVVMAAPGDTRQAAQTIVLKEPGSARTAHEIARGKREYEKRDVLKKRDTDREIRAEIKKRLR